MEVGCLKDGLARTRRCLIAFALLILVQSADARLSIVSAVSESGSTVVSGTSVTLTCTTSQPWFMCIWQGPGGIACQCQTQTNGVNAMCAAYPKLTLTGGSTTCSATIQVVDIEDAGSWKCILSDQQDFVTVSRVIEMEVGTPAVLTWVNMGNVLSLTEGDETEIACLAKEGWPVPEITFQGSNSIHRGRLENGGQNGNNVPEVIQYATYTGDLSDHNNDLICMAEQRDRSGAVLFNSQIEAMIQVAAVEEAGLLIPIGGIIGIIFALLFLLLLLCLLLYCCCIPTSWWRNKKETVQFIEVHENPEAEGGKDSAEGIVFNYGEIHSHENKSGNYFIESRKEEEGMQGSVDVLAPLIGKKSDSSSSSSSSGSSSDSLYKEKQRKNVQFSNSNSKHSYQKCEESDDNASSSMSAKYAKSKKETSNVQMTRQDTTIIVIASDNLRGSGSDIGKKSKSFKSDDSLLEQQFSRDQRMNDSVSVTTRESDRVENNFVHTTYHGSIDNSVSKSSKDKLSFNVERDFDDEQMKQHHNMLFLSELEKQKKAYSVSDIEIMSNASRASAENKHMHLNGGRTEERPYFSASTGVLNASKPSKTVGFHQNGYVIETHEMNEQRNDFLAKSDDSYDTKQYARYNDQHYYIGDSEYVEVVEEHVKGKFEDDLNYYAQKIKDKVEVNPKLIKLSDVLRQEQMTREEMTFEQQTTQPKVPVPVVNEKKSKLLDLILEEDLREREKAGVDVPEDSGLIKTALWVSTERLDRSPDSEFSQATFKLPDKNGDQESDVYEQDRSDESVLTDVLITRKRMKSDSDQSSVSTSQRNAYQHIADHLKAKERATEIPKIYVGSPLRVDNASFDYSQNVIGNGKSGNFSTSNSSVSNKNTKIHKVTQPQGDELKGKKTVSQQVKITQQEIVFYLKGTDGVLRVIKRPLIHSGDQQIEVRKDNAKERRVTHLSSPNLHETSSQLDENHFAFDDIQHQDGRTSRSTSSKNSEMESYHHIKNVGVIHNSTMVNEHYQERYEMKNWRSSGSIFECEMRCFDLEKTENSTGTQH